MKLPPSQEIVQENISVTTMEIEDPPTTSQEDQVPKVAILDAPLIMEVEHGKEDSIIFSVKNI
jgi:hypothetical protein